MPETINPKGQCLCGKVTISLHDTKPEIGVCHCTMCRNWSGGPFLSLDAGQNISLDGVDSVSSYASSEWAERAFCKHCGTHLYYRLKHNNAHHVLVGLFRENNQLTMDHQIFIDQKPDYYSFSQNTKVSTSAEVMAMFAGEN